MCGNTGLVCCRAASVVGKGAGASRTRPLRVSAAPDAVGGCTPGPDAGHSEAPQRGSRFRRDPESKEAVAGHSAGEDRQTPDGRDVAPSAVACGAVCWVGSWWGSGRRLESALTPVGGDLGARGCARADVAFTGAGLRAGAGSAR